MRLLHDSEMWKRAIDSLSQVIFHSSHAVLSHTHNKKYVMQVSYVTQAEEAYAYSTILPWCSAYLTNR